MMATAELRDEASDIEETLISLKFEQPCPRRPIAEIHVGFGVLHQNVFEPQLW